MLAAFDAAITFVVNHKVKTVKSISFDDDEVRQFQPAIQRARFGPSVTVIDRTVKRMRCCCAAAAGDRPGGRR